jgi:hypothetical protein
MIPLLSPAMVFPVIARLQWIATGVVSSITAIDDIKDVIRVVLEASNE